MDSLTDEQRRLIELNRQRALERGRERRAGGMNIENERNYNLSQSATAANNFHVETTTTTIAKARESFGDGGIDWEAAVGDMDRLLGSTSGNSNVSAQALNNIITHSTNQCVGLKDSKRQRIENCTISNASQLNAHKSTGLTEEQRAMIEENRRKALERKQQQQHQQKSQSNSTSIHCPPSSPSSSRNNEQQRARIEENRLKALAKKQALSSQNNISVCRPNNPTSSTTTVQCPSPTTTLCIQEQNRGRIEENRRRALERKQALSSQQQMTSTTIQQCSSPTSMHSDEQKARMEENRRRALERKQQRLKETQQQQQCQGPSPASSNNEVSRYMISNPQLKPPLAAASLSAANNLNDEQRARMEESRRRALEKKQQRSRQHQQQQLVVASASMPLVQCPSPMMITAKNSNNKACPSPSINDEQRARMEENRRKALQRKQQALQKHNNATSESGIAEINQQVPPPPPPAPPSAKKKSALPPLPPDLQYEESRVLPVDDGHIDTLIENAQLDQPLLNDMNLFDHQKEGVLRALRMRRLILAFDMGLGKYRFCSWPTGSRHVVEQSVVLCCRLSPTSLNF